MTFDTIAPGWIETALVASGSASNREQEGAVLDPAHLVGEVRGERGQVARRHLERLVPEREADPALQHPQHDRPCRPVFGHVPTFRQGDQHDAEAGSIHDRGRRVIVALVGR